MNRQPTTAFSPRLKIPEPYRSILFAILGATLVFCFLFVKSYRDIDYRFQLRYPSLWSLQVGKVEGIPSVIFVSPKIKHAGEERFAWIEVRKAAADPEISAAIVQQLSETYEVLKIESFYQVAGQPAKQLVFNAKDEKVYFTLFSFRGVDYEVEGHFPQLIGLREWTPVYFLVLKTFRFSP